MKYSYVNVTSKYDVSHVTQLLTAEKFSWVLHGPTDRLGNGHHQTGCPAQAEQLWRARLTNAFTPGSHVLGPGGAILLQNLTLSVLSTRNAGDWRLCHAYLFMMAELILAVVCEINAARGSNTAIGDVDARPSGE
jgi:hypothetical protein